jgi:GntR family transcriptional regulator, transcriptional repressor for pyruvate dehydrogenase complex
MNTHPDFTSQEPLPRPKRARKRTDEIVDAIKRSIIDLSLEPGDRLPQEKDLMIQFAASKGTVREALKSLEVQGLIRTRTGPGGGAFLERTSERRAMSLLSNYLFDKAISIADIYALRKVLEPVVAVSAMQHIDEDGYRRLGEIIAVYDHEPRDAQERWDQRMAELDFHGVVAEYSDNALLAFVCRFLQRLLKDLAVCHNIYRLNQPVLRARGISFQREMIAAMRAGDNGAVAAIMTEHMADAERQMLSLEASVESRFLDEG